jgi:uncharacterized membrane protein
MLLSLLSNVFVVIVVVVVVVVVVVAVVVAAAVAAAVRWCTDSEPQLNAAVVASDLMQEPNRKQMRIISQNYFEFWNSWQTTRKLPHFGVVF